MRLFQGDCLDILPTLPAASVDLVLCDPPYGMKFRSNYRKVRHDAIANDEGVDWLPRFCDEMARVMKPDSAAYLFCSFHQIDVFKQEIERVLTLKNVLVWEKNNTSMGDLKGDFAPKVEFVILAHKGRALIRGKRDPNIFRFARTGNDLHPTQKPVDLCEYLADKFSDVGGVVLDPFMGSGTTGVAAVNTGRDFIGIEKDPGYFAIAERRIYEALDEAWAA